MKRGQRCQNVADAARHRCLKPLYSHSGAKTPFSPKGGSWAAVIERPKGTLEEGASPAASGRLRSLKVSLQKPPIPSPIEHARKVYVFRFEFRKCLLGDLGSVDYGSSAKQARARTRFSPTRNPRRAVD
jgi:hypothetical protein